MLTKHMLTNYCMKGFIKFLQQIVQPGITSHHTFFLSFWWPFQDQLESLSTSHSNISTWFFASRESTVSGSIKGMLHFLRQSIQLYCSMLIAVNEFV